MPNVYKTSLGAFMLLFLPFLLLLLNLQKLTSVAGFANS